MQKITRALRFVLDQVIGLLFPVVDLPNSFEHLPRADLSSLSGNAHARTHALFAYADEQVKHIVWEIKYYKNEKLSDDVGHLIAECIVRHTEKSVSKLTKPSLAPIFLVPVPLTSKRLRERGFNHTDMLARSILKHLPAEHFALAPHTQKKIRHTPKQSSLVDRAERLQNLVGAFEISAESKKAADSVADKNFIIIDDVITTGATVTEVKKTLVAAGGNVIGIYAIAH